MYWLLEKIAFDMMRQAVEAGNIPTAAQEIEYEARDRSNDVLTIVGDKAEIAIVGVLTPRPNFLAFLFGGGNTVYGDIVSALADAERDPNVREILLAIDSPGGTVAGLVSTTDALKASVKPLRAIVHNTGASAAYAIAAQADEIFAINRMTRIGSVGVAATFTVPEDRVIVTSTQAPLKSPDPRTEEGRAAIRDELDAMHRIFVDTIAKGRNIASEKVNADFGRGATVLAEDALGRGMIDGVEGVNPKTAANDGGKRRTEAKSMDLQALKTEHPDVYAQAVAVGVADERDRVKAHLTMGEAGDMKTAVAAIRDGSDMTQELTAKYMVAGRNHTDTDNRTADDTAAADAVDNVEPSGQDAEADQVATVVESIVGGGV